MIYLVSSDGYKDSIDMSYYATNEEEIECILKKKLYDLGDVLIPHTMYIDFKKMKINFLYREYDDTIEDVPSIGRYYLHQIERVF